MADRPDNGNPQKKRFEAWLEQTARNEDRSKQEILHRMMASFWVLNEFEDMFAEDPSVSIQDLELGQESFDLGSKPAETPTSDHQDTNSTKETLGKYVAEIAAYLDNHSTTTSHRDAGHASTPRADAPLASEVEDIGETVDELADDQDNLKDTLDQLTDTIETLTEDQDSLVQDQDTLKKVLNRLRNTVESLEQNLNALETDQDSLGDTVNALETNQDALEDTQNRLETDYETITDTLNEVTSTVESLQTDIDALETNQKSLETTQQTLRDTFNQVADTVESLQHDQNTLEDTQNSIIDTVERIETQYSNLSTDHEQLVGRVDGDFEQVEKILKHLVDRTNARGDAITDLERSLTTLLEDRRETRRSMNRLKDVLESAHQQGIESGECDACGGSIDLALLREPECPHCDRQIDGVRPGGWFRANTITTGNRPRSIQQTNKPLPEDGPQHKFRDQNPTTSSQNQQPQEASDTESTTTQSNQTENNNGLDWIDR